MHGSRPPIPFRCGILAVLLLSSLGVPAQRQFSIAFPPGEKIRITEKSNLRKYEDGRFIGLSYREVRGVLRADHPNLTSEIAIATTSWAEPREGTTSSLPEWIAEEGQFLSGSFYVFEETKRENRLVARRIETTVRAEFFSRPDGSYAVPASQGYPSLRSFPVFPVTPLDPGDTWQAFGERAVEPFRDSRFTRVRFYCQYRYEGSAEVDGTEVDVVSAQYAMRYREGDDLSGDERITRVTGKHAVAIHVDRGTGALRFMRDTVDELYELEDGGSLGFKGFILTWFDGVSRMDRGVVEDTVAQVLREAVSQPDSPEAGASLSDISIESREEGVVLSINRIHFVADQAVILPEERPRLQAVAEALKQIEGRTFLVVGHTARIGSDESQYALSVERAKTIVDYLASQGMEAGRFLYEGRGGTQPLAPNDVEENMAKNRRVEIIILED